MQVSIRKPVHMGVSFIICMFFIALLLDFMIDRLSIVCAYAGARWCTGASIIGRSCDKHIALRLQYMIE